MIGPFQIHRLAIILPSPEVIEQPRGMDARMTRHSRKVKSLLNRGKSDTFPTMIDTQVLSRGGKEVQSPTNGL